MIYSDTFKFVYLNTPKSGSSSITEMLKRFYGAKSYKDRHDNRIPAEMGDYFIFASVRHPFARAISGYSYLVEDLPVDKAFERFHMISQVDYLYNYDLAIEERVSVSSTWKEYATPAKRRLDAVIHLESLVDDFNDLPFVTKKQNAFLCHNRGNPELRKWEKDDEIWEYIVRNCMDDFTVFGYDKVRSAEPLLS